MWRRYLRRKRGRLFVGLLSTVCFVTLGIHGIISANWSRMSMTGDTDSEDLQLVRDQGIKRDQHMEGNINSVRQLTSIDNPNKGVLPKEKIDKARSRKKTPEPTRTERAKKTEVNATKNDGTDEEEQFTGCDGEGTVDMSAYPFIDARTIYCGEAVRGNAGERTVIRHVRVPGAISNTILSSLLVGQGSNMEDGGNIPLVYIAGQEPLRLSGVEVPGHRDTVVAKSASRLEGGERKVMHHREIPVDGQGGYNAGPFLFFPPILSDFKILMRFLRTLYKICVFDRKGGSAPYAITVKKFKLAEVSLPTPFCVYMGVVGGGIKESYLIGMRKCRQLHLPKSIRACSLAGVVL